MPRRPVVLVIEEQAELRRVIRDVLDDEGYEVLPVRDRSEAISILREQPVDLLVSDLAEPEEDAVDPLEEVSREFPDLWVISLSDDSHAAGPFFGPWRISGFRMTLRRPFRIDDLIAASKEITG
jgi:CheY-like chemotaxis protein